MESLKEYKTKRLMREVKKYKTLYEECYNDYYRQKMLLNVMAKENTDLKKELIEIKFKNDIEDNVNKIKKDIE